MVMKVGLMLSLLSSIFVCCNQQEGNAKQFLPIDTIVSGFILDDYVNFNKRIQNATIKMNSLAKYGECIIFCNSDSSEYFILCANYGGFAGQYDKFVVIATDGFWKYVLNDEVIEIVSYYYNLNDCDSAVVKLYEIAYNRWMHKHRYIKDISIIVVFIE